MSRGLTMPDGTHDTQTAADLLRALAHPMRLRILYRLLDSEVSVTGLEAELGLRQPNLSQQLGHLRDAKLVLTRRRAKSVFYSLADDRVRDIIAAFRQALSGIPLPQGASVNRPQVAVPIVEPELRHINKLPRSLRAPQTNECGVFAVVGWPARDHTQAPGDTGRGKTFPPRQP